LRALILYVPGGSLRPPSLPVNGTRLIPRCPRTEIVPATRHAGETCVTVKVTRAARGSRNANVACTCPRFPFCTTTGRDVCTTVTGTTVTGGCCPAPEWVCELDVDGDPLGCADPPPEEPPPPDGVDVVFDPLGGGVVVVVGVDVVVGRGGVVTVGVVGNGLVGNGVVVGRGGTVTETEVVGTGSVGTTSARATRAPSPAPNAAARRAASRRDLPTSITLITPFPRFWLRAK
jgi:hypothetical protein